jgi:hypothetical protein
VVNESVFSDRSRSFEAPTVHGRNRGRADKVQSPHSLSNDRTAKRSPVRGGCGFVWFFDLFADAVRLGRLAVGRSRSAVVSPGRGAHARNVKVQSVRLWARPTTPIDKQNRLRNALWQSLPLPPYLPPAVRCARPSVRRYCSYVEIC